MSLFLKVLIVSRVSPIDSPWSRFPRIVKKGTKDAENTFAMDRNKISSPKVSKPVRRVRISLRYKMLAILTMIPLITLALYLALAVTEFANDKEAYVYDSGVAVSRSLATQTRVELEGLMSLLMPILEGFDPEKSAFTIESQELFLKYPRLGAILALKDEGGHSSQIASLVNPTFRGSDIFAGDDSLEAQVATVLRGQEWTVMSYAPVENALIVATRIPGGLNAALTSVVILYRAETLVKSFSQVPIYSSVLVDQRGQMALGPSDMRGTPLEGKDLAQYFKPVLVMGTPEGSKEIRSDDQISLVSFAEVGVGGLSVISVVDRAKALRAVMVLVTKSLLFFGALLAATLLISIFASTQLTSTLRDLYEATRKIAGGKFDIRVRSQSNDEIGGLADGFNVMAAEVSRLMSETAEKARMENELATVRTVQETLFPPPESTFGNVHIVGHFEPASECGGDWWSYSNVGDITYLWIGDATGHGAPAALITSAARSAAAIVETLPDMSPGKALAILNQAIHETSKGKINMTFFLAAINQKTGKMTYANASHDPPYLIRKPKGRAVTKKDLVPLMDVNGLRLGEKKGSTYEESEIDILPGDSFVFYTDGIIDLQSPDGKTWGERTFLKNVVEASSGQTLQDKMNYIKQSIIAYRGEAELLDDITLFMAEIEEAA